MDPLFLATYSREKRGLRDTKEIIQPSFQLYVIVLEKISAECAAHSKILFSSLINDVNL